MIIPEQWMPQFLDRLKTEFGGRLVYLGLQGSVRRGEAGEDSDIDLVTVLDALSLGDLDRYRAVVRSMPEGDKACGFISDRATLASWPKSELFGFKMDTRDYHGELAPLLPPIGREDICSGVRNGASGLYHLVAHSYLYAPDGEKPAVLAGAYKGAYFVMLLAEYLRTGVYYQKKADLTAALHDRDREIMAASVDFERWVGGHDLDEAAAMLLDWSREVLAAMRV
jgi:hypothetical protein